MKKLIVSVLVVVLVGFAAADASIIRPLGEGESDLNSRELRSKVVNDFLLTSGDALNGYLDLNGNSLNNYFDSPCASQEAIFGVFDNGTLKCRSVPINAKNLSKTLEVGHRAGSYDIKMSGNNITNLAWLNPSSDWKTGGSIEQPLSYLAGIGFVQDGTDLDGAVDNAYSGGFLYTVATNSDRLTVVDVRDVTNPTVLSSVQDSTDLSGPEAVDVAGRYAYVAAGGNDALTAVNISNPSEPVVTGSVSSSSDLDLVRDLDVVGGYAYMAAQNSNALTVVDISDPANPTVAGTVSDSSDLNEPYGVDVSGSYAYVSSDSGNSLTAVDISDPASPSIAGVVSDSTYLNRAFDVSVSGRYAYVAGYGGSFGVVDISDPSNPSVTGGISDSKVDGAAAVEVSGDNAYVASAFNRSLRSVDISNPSNPVLEEGFSSVVYSGVEGLSVAGPIAYTSNYNNDVVATTEITPTVSPAADIGSLAVNDLYVSEEAIVEQSLKVQSGLNVGPRGIKTDGKLVAESYEATGTKNFVQKINSTHSVVYTSSESGEAVVEWSDTVNVSEGANSIWFPRHYRYVLSDEEDYHVFIQPRSFVELEVVEKRKDGFLVEASGGSTVDVHVRGVREGFEDTRPLRKR